MHALALCLHLLTVADLLRLSSKTCSELLVLLSVKYVSVRRWLILGVLTPAESCAPATVCALSTYLDITLSSLHTAGVPAPSGTDRLDL